MKAFSTNRLQSHVQRPSKVECHWHTASVVVDLEGGASPQRKGVDWTEQARHMVLLLRLQRPYYVYCICCCVLSVAAFVSTLIDIVRQHDEGVNWHDVLEGSNWQSACWITVALALCTEVVSAAVVRRGSWTGLFVDWWSTFDAALVILTLFAWGLMRFRRASLVREEAEQVDLWLLALRFALQPCRVFAAARRAHQVQQMQREHSDVNFDILLDGSAVKQGHSDVMQQVLYQL